MSEKIDETMSRARKMGKEIDESIHERIEELSRIVLEQQRAIDDVVHEQPYMAIGVGILAGVGLGVILCSLVRRRD